MAVETTNRLGPPRWSEIVSAGIVAGLIAGVLMALAAMIRSAVVGLGFWLPMQLVAGLYFGVEALLGGVGMILAGIGTHLAIAAAWGVVFAVITGGRLQAGTAFIVGLIFGGVVWVIMTYLVLPWADPTMLARVNVARGWFFFYHMIYGATLTLAPGMARSFHGGQRQVSREAPMPA